MSCLLFSGSRPLVWLATLLLASAARALTAPIAPDGRETLGQRVRLLAPDLLEVELVQRREADGSQPATLVTPAAAVVRPTPAQFTVTIKGEPVAVRTVDFKRRALVAPLARRALQVGSWLYLRLDRAVPAEAEVQVANPDGALWPENTVLRARLDRLRLSPVIHVNQEGYLPELPKKAAVGYFLGTAGEMRIPTDRGFAVVTLAGAVVYTGKLERRREEGFAYSPAPYQEVYEADFSGFRTPGQYRIVVPELGASLPFVISDGVAMNFARTYALGLYHQRCGMENTLPFTRFVHAACHVAPAEVPVPASAHPFTWKKIAQLSGEGEGAASQLAPPLNGEDAQLFPFVRQGTVNVAGGHHDAGDYSKYTINSAALVHTLIFGVDALAGAADLDNLGLPESGDGISDLLQEAKIEVDFLMRLQDEDGGFYFLVYPRERPYENNVLPEHGDRQVVWPKNTAATAAAVAALAQASSSPHFRRAYPAAAAAALSQAQQGWRFLMEAHRRHGLAGSYQRLTHYGDDDRDRDELAWAACELFLATGDRHYQEKFSQWCDPTSPATRRWGWWRLSQSWGNAIRSYAFGARTGRRQVAEMDRWLLEKCEQEVEAAGRDVLRWTRHSAYGTGFPDETKRVRGGGWYFSLDQAFDLVVASQLDYPKENDPRAAFLEAYVANINYEAGMNPVNMAYLTGLGQRRPREVVHQYAENDRRVLPPSGLPVGNIQSGLPYLAHYQGELGALSLPEDGAATAPYPFYDRWTDTFNPATEFVIVNQARALTGLAWLAARTSAARQPWRAATARIADLPGKVAVNEPVTASLVAPSGLNLADAEIVWEARDQEPALGLTFTFQPRSHGRQWVEAEARWPDGRRVFAVADFMADNGRPIVSVTTPTPVAAVTDGGRGVFVFRRTGDLRAPLTVRYELRGEAVKWNDYRRPEGDMPVEIVIPAGAETVELTILPVAASLRAARREVKLELARDDAYNFEAQQSAEVMLIGEGLPAEVASAPGA